MIRMLEEITVGPLGAEYEGRKIFLPGQIVSKEEIDTVYGYEHAFDADQAGFYEWAVDSGFAEYVA